MEMEMFFWIKLTLWSLRKVQVLPLPFKISCKPCSGHWLMQNESSVSQSGCPWFSTKLSLYQQRKGSRNRWKWGCYSKNGGKINKGLRLWEGKIMFFRGGTVDLSGTRFPKEIQIPWPLGHSNGKFWSKLSPSLILFFSWLQLIVCT